MGGLGFRDPCNPSPKQPVFEVPQASATSWPVQNYDLHATRPSSDRLMGFLEGQGDLVSGRKPPRTHVVTLTVPFVKLLNKSP